MPLNFTTDDFEETEPSEPLTFNESDFSDTPQESTFKKVSKAVGRPFIESGDLLSRAAKAAALTAVGEPGLAKQEFASLGLDQLSPETQRDIEASGEDNTSPYDEARKTLPMVERAASGIAPGLIGSAPQLAATMVAGPAGAATFGLNKEGFDPVQAVAAIIAPGAGKILGNVAAKVAAKSGITSQAAMALIDRVGGATGVAGIMSAPAVAQIASMAPGEERDQAIEDTAANALLMGVLGGSGERGETALSPKSTKPIAKVISRELLNAEVQQAAPRPKIGFTVADFDPAGKTEPVLPPPEAPTTPAQAPKPPEAVLTPRDTTASPTATQDVGNAAPIAVATPTPSQPEIPLGLNRPSRQNPELRMMTDEEFDSEFSDAKNKVNDAEKKMDETGSEDLTPDQRQAIGAIQDRYDAARLERYRRNTHGTHPADLMRDLKNMAGKAVQFGKDSLEYQKARIILEEMRRQDATPEQMLSEVKLTSPDAAEVFKADLEDIKKISQPAVEAAKTAPVSGVKPAPEQSLEKSATSETGKPTAMVSDKETVEIPLENLSLSADVPQFKSNANEKGVVKPIGGKFDRRGLAPIQVWRRMDGRLEIISGRHRFDLAQRTGEKTIPAQIHNEADGFDARAAARLDAELNIRDEQGEVTDYANYFKDSGITEADAKERGLLARAKGKAGFAIARDAGEDLFALHQSGKITDAQADAIARTAPGEPGLQAVGIRAALDGKPAETAADLVTLAKQRVDNRKAEGNQNDLFGFDDSAIQEMEAQSKLASDERKTIREQVQAIKGAAKKPAIAKQFNIDVKDPEGITKKVVELEARLATLKDHPELAGKLDTGSVKPPEVAKPAEAPKETQKPQQIPESMPLGQKPINPVFPRELAQRMLSLSREAQTSAYGPRNEELRRDIIGAITGTRPPKSKAGAKAVETILAKHFGIDTAELAGIQVEDQLRQKLQAIVDSETPEAKPTLSLDMESDAQQAAREAQEAAVAKTKTDKENLAQQAAKPLVGSVGDIGQGDLLGGGDLLSGEKASDGERVAAEKAKAETDSVEAKRIADENQTGFIGMGGAVPSEFGGGTPTAMKYRMIDSERAKRGLPPITKPESVSDQALMDKAMGEIDRNPKLPNDLVQELLKKPRTIEPWERMVLLLHKLDLRENYERSARDAAQAYDDSKQFPDRNADMLRHNIETARLSNELTDLERASRISGSETGRALRALRIMANEDYSLAGLETSARAAKGGAPITIEERAQLQKIADDYAKEAANSKGDALRARESEAEAKRRLDEILKQPKPEPVAPHIRLVAEKLKGFFDTQAKSALERIKARRAEGRMFNDPGAILSGGKLSTEDMVDYAAYGASKLFEKGIESAEMTAEWAKEMKDELGDVITPHLDAIWKASLKTFQDGFKKVVGTDEVTRKKVKHAVKQLTPDENKTRVSEIIQEKMKDGDLSSVATSVQQLAKLFVESGIKTRDELIDAVHGVLSGMDETITRRDTMDAISGYGDFKQLSKDEVSVTLRDLKRQMQEVAKLEDMAGGTSPKKTGIERAEWSKEQARLQKLVNDAKFNFQVPSTDPRTQLQSALDTFKKRTQGRIDDFQRRIAEGDFSKKPRRELTLDPEALRSKANLEAIKRKFDGMKEKWRRESLPGVEKGLDWVSAVRRFDALSGVSVLFKLAAYTATKIPTMAAEEIAGHVLQRLPGIRQIASKAPFEGAASISILSRSVAKGFTKGMVDAYNVGTKGHSEIKSAFSTRPEIARHWTDVPVIIHEIIKSPLRRTSFENSLAKRMEHAAKNGADITDPVTQLRLAQEAYLDSDRDLLLEKNRVASGIRSFLKRMEQPNKATGKVPIYAKAAATIGRIETPVLSVPFNFAKQALTAAFGLISGSVRAREAFKVGIDNLKPEEADAIMRHLKMGSIGGAVALFGFIDGWNNYNTPQNSTFGGYYQQGEKRKPGQAGVGGMKIGETKIPGLFLHNPVLSVGQLGHTVGSVLHQKMQKEGIGNAMMVAPLVGFVGLVNDSPVGRQVELLTQLGNAGTADYGLGEHLKGILVPQLLNEIARQSDQPNLDLKKFLTGTAMKRYPKTPIQHIKTAIPGLRQTVPNTKKNVMSE